MKQKTTSTSYCFVMPDIGEHAICRIHLTTLMELEMTHSIACSSETSTNPCYRPMIDQPKPIWKPNFTRLQLMQGQACVVINGGGRSMKINGIDLTSTDPSWLPFLPIKASQIPILGPQKKKKEEGSKCRKPQPQNRRERERKTLKTLRKEGSSHKEKKRGV